MTRVVDTLSTNRVSVKLEATPTNIKRTIRDIFDLFPLPQHHVVLRHLRPLMLGFDKNFQSRLYLRRSRSFIRFSAPTSLDLLP